MRIEGRWMVAPDGVVRPVCDGSIVTADNNQIYIPFLIDTGADLTILAPSIAHQLAGVVQPVATATHAEGIGGTQKVYHIAVDLLFPTTTGQRARIRGPLPILLTIGSLELSVLGRDFLDQ